MATAHQINQLNELCSDHPVATCPECREAFEIAELSYHTPAQIEAGELVVEWPDAEEWTRCPRCGRSLMDEIDLHIEECPDFVA